MGVESEYDISFLIKHVFSYFFRNFVFFCTRSVYKREGNPSKGKKKSSENFLHQKLGGYAKNQCAISSITNAMPDSSKFMYFSGFFFVYFSGFFSGPELCIIKKGVTVKI